MTFCACFVIIKITQGNPTSYLGHTLTWEKGRQLKSYDSNTYTYNANGIRTSKTVGGVKHTYTLDGTKILREVWGSNTLIPLYDNEENVCGISYNYTPYYFIKNQQGDVIAIVDKDAQTVARYSYDAWGDHKIYDANGTKVTSTTHIGYINPFRYRGYYYDEEIDLYYLQSRYYDAEIGRFINGDEVEMIICNKTALQLNLSAYCNNDCVNKFDADGFWSWTVKRDKLAFAIDMILTLVGAWAKFAYDLIGTLLKKACNWFLKKRGKRYILDILLGTVPKIVGWAGKFLTVIRTVLWRIGFVGLSAIVSRATDWFFEQVNNIANRYLSAENQNAVEILVCFFSAGGMIAFMLDLFTDNKADGIVKLI